MKPMPDKSLPGWTAPGDVDPGGPASGPDFVPGWGVDSAAIRDYVAVLRRHWFLVIACALAGLGLAAYLVYTTPPTYSAAAAVRFVDNRGALTSGLGNDAATKIAGPITDPLLSQVQVLRSRAVAAQVVDKVGLRLSVMPVRGSAGMLKDTWVDPDIESDTLSLAFSAQGVTVSAHGRSATAAFNQPVQLDGVRFTVRPVKRSGSVKIVVVPRETAIAWLTQNVHAAVREKTDFIDVSIEAQDPKMAQEVVNAAIDAFRDINAGSAQQQSRRRRVFIESQLVHTDSALNAAQLALSDFRSRAQVYSSKEKLTGQQAALAELESRREQMDTDRRIARGLLDRLRGSGAQRDQGLQAMLSSPEIASDPVMSQLFAKLLQYQTSRDSLTAGAFGSAATNPDVQRLDQLITSTRGKLLTALQGHVSALDDRISALDALRQRNGTELQGLPPMEAEEVRLVQRLEAIAKLADQLREEQQKARISEAVEVGQVEIVDRATLPTHPIGTAPTRKLLFGLLVGLMLGAGSSYLMENLNTFINRQGEVESMLNLSVLAVVPPISEKTTGRRKRRVKPGADADQQTELVTITKAHSSAAEAYRTLRTNLIFSQTARTFKTIVVTSASPGEGKTTTAANLAVTFAQQGIRVLLVDCDLRRARLHKVFDVAREPGLTQLVLGHTAAADAVHATTVPGLSVLASGTLPPNPSELLGGLRMRNALATLGETFDMILIDSPPLMAAADAAILGTMVDGVLLVVRSGHTERAAAQLAVQQLLQVGAPVLGAVLNDPEANVPKYGGYYYYDYYGGSD
jgi:tyrosine-protein kinase Etk/Wzc